VNTNPSCLKNLHSNIKSYFEKASTIFFCFKLFVALWPANSIIKKSLDSFIAEKEDKKCHLKLFLEKETKKNTFLSFYSGWQ